MFISITTTKADRGKKFERRIRKRENVAQEIHYAIDVNISNTHNFGDCINQKGNSCIAEVSIMLDE